MRSTNVLDIHVAGLVAVWHEVNQAGKLHGPQFRVAVDLEVTSPALARAPLHDGTEYWKYAMAPWQ